MSEPTVSDQLFGQQPAASNDVASQLFGDSATTTSVADQLFGSADSVASQLFDDNNGIDIDDDGLEPDDDTGEVEELESNELDPEDEDLADEQESVMSQLFGSTEAVPDVASQLFGQTASPSVEDQLFGQATSNEQSVEDRLFGASADFVEGGFVGPSPELVIAMLSGLLTPKPVSGAPSVNITFQGPVTFNL
jgi:hypothetical protein